MIKINKFILIICFLVLLLMFIICKNDILYFLNNSTNKLLGGNTDANSVDATSVDANSVDANSVDANSVDANSVATNQANSNIEIADLTNTLRNEQSQISKIKNELDSLRRNRQFDLDNLVDDDKSNSNYVRVKRDILENSDGDVIENVVQNELNNQETLEDEETLESEETLEDEELNKIQKAKAWEHMCEDDYKDKRKKHKYMDLKLDLNTSLNLEPFNNDDYSEFGKFNC